MTYNSLFRPFLPTFVSYNIFLFFFFFLASVFLMPRGDFNIKMERKKNYGDENNDDYDDEDSFK